VPWAHRRFTLMGQLPAAEATNPTAVATRLDSSAIGCDVWSLSVWDCAA
jgi:hypothetical protein